MPTARDVPIDQALARAGRELAGAVAACTACELAGHRTTPVTGEGPLDAELVVVASVPRSHEDLQGRPVAGAARNVLDHGMRRVGLDPAAVRLTTAVRCRPKDDEPPSEAQIAACSVHLRAELELVRPRVIVTLGALATAAVLRRSVPLATVAGYRLEALDGTATLVPTYEPSAVVRGDRGAAAVFDRHLAVAHAVLTGKLTTGAQARAAAHAAAARTAPVRAGSTPARPVAVAPGRAGS
jgi:uracil-DNA glycosylase